MEGLEDTFGLKGDLRSGDDGNSKLFGSNEMFRIKSKISATMSTSGV